MPSPCCIQNCCFQSKPFHRFPKDPGLRQKWLEAIGQKNVLGRVPDRLLICDAHFCDDFKFPRQPHQRSNLKFNAYPTLHLGDKSRPCQSAIDQEPRFLEAATSATTNQNVIPELVPIDVAPDVAFEIEVTSEDVTNSEDVLITEDVLIEGPELKSPADPKDTLLKKCKLSSAKSSLMNREKERGQGLPKKKVKRVQRGTSSPTFKQHLNFELSQGSKGSSQGSQYKKIGSQVPTCSMQRRNLKKIANNLLHFAETLEDKNLSNEKHLSEIIEFAESERFIKGRINKISYRFLMCQITQQQKKSRGRRYSLQDKIFALSLMKQGPKLYRLLKQVFALPSRKTLTEMLKKASLSPGINRQIIKNLELKVTKMKPLAKYCMLLFDETALTPALTYNKMEDCIEGIEDVGERKDRIADHVMVFMLRGVATKWKQPVAHFFVKSTMRKEQIAKNVKEIISLAHKSGLRVVGTVCDQYSSSAINYLVDNSKAEFLRHNGHEEYRSSGFFVENREVIPIFDVPHLIKGIRNGLLKYNCQFQWKKGIQRASWAHIVQFYEMDIGDYDTKMCNRLTDAHVYEDKMRKMNVRCAAQVFSQRVSASIRAVAEYANDRLPKNANDTADFLLFMDKVFDSLNGSSIKGEYTKLLRCAIQENSPHMKFYNQAIKVFSTMQFITESGSKQIPSIKNFVKTLKGVKEIWKMCQKEGFTFLCTRNLNQDPLENFFGMIKSYGYRNVSPTCSSFQCSFKALLINNFFSSHSPSANCEEDSCEAGITSFESFLKGSQDVLKPVPHDDFSSISNLKRNFKPKTQRDIVVQQQNAYISGYIGKKMLKELQGCKTCVAQIKATQNELHHKYINFRNYTNPYGTALFKPNSYFFYLFNLCTEVLHHFLPKIYHRLSLRKKLIALCKEYITPIFSCDKHDLLNIFLNNFTNFYLFTWTNNINLILKGHSTKTNDDVKKEALEYYNKHKAKKIKMAKTKQQNN